MKRTLCGDPFPLGVEQRRPIAPLRVDALFSRARDWIVPGQITGGFDGSKVLSILTMAVGSGNCIHKKGFQTGSSIARACLNLQRILQFLGCQIGPKSFKPTIVVATSIVCTLLFRLKKRRNKVFGGDSSSFLSRRSSMATQLKKSKSVTAKFDSPQQEAYLNLWRTYDRLRMLEDRLFQPFDLTCQQYNVLRLLLASRPEPVPTLTLAQRLVSRAPDITRMLDKLESKRLIERVRPAENRRQVLASITAEGVKLLKSLERPLQECHQNQLGHMSASDLKKLCQLLKLARRTHEDSNSVWS